MGLVEGAPFVLTLRLDPPSFLRLEEERQAYFPAHLNRVPAHISLFHLLPAEQNAAIDRVLEDTALAHAPFAVPVVRVRSLGRGVAYVIESPPLVELRGRLSAAFQPWLTAQDRQRFQPHITIQNKVTSEEARRSLAAIEARFQPFTAIGVGVCLWRYLGGPWQLERTYRFADQAISVAGPMSP